VPKRPERKQIKKVKITIENTGKYYFSGQFALHSPPNLSDQPPEGVLIFRLSRSLIKVDQGFIQLAIFVSSVLLSQAASGVNFLLLKCVHSALQQACRFPIRACFIHLKPTEKGNVSVTCETPHLCRYSDATIHATVLR
jgi:hypothetical protein